MLTPVFFRRLIAVLLVLAPLTATMTAATAQGSGGRDKPEGGRVVLVLPFDNRSGNPNLNWMADSFPDTLNQRLNSAGFLALTRDDRLFALDHLGLPLDFRPSRATTIRIAQNLDADYVIVGSYNLQNGRVSVQAQVLEVNRLHLSAPLDDSAELGRLFDVENAIAWKIARQIDPNFQVAQQTFLSASSGIQLAAFENYIRGTDSGTSAERIKRLQAAIHDAPGYTDAILALGKEYYAVRDFDQAAETLAKVPLTERQALEANFYLGLARFNSARYDDAERAFAVVGERLPLPEVINDEGVALDRQGKDGSPQFQRAATADPNNPDYHYNLALTEYRRGDFAGAKRNIDQALQVRSSDSEAAELRAMIAAGRATVSRPAGGFEPTTRLVRTWSEASFRQAAFQMQQIQAQRIATLPRKEQAEQYSQIGTNDLEQGLLPDAEQQFDAAIAADPTNAMAHVGLAQVRVRSGSMEDARKEALLALKYRQSAGAYITLAQIDYARGNNAAAAAEIQQALQVEPNNASALALRKALSGKP